MLAHLVALTLAAHPRLAVMPIAAGEGVPASTAAALTESLAAEVRRRSGVEVITRREIEAILSLEAQKQMLGCQTDACMAELGGALGVEGLVAGDLARLGESWLVHLKVVDAGKMKVSAQSDRRIRGGTIDDVLDVLPTMAAELFPATAGGATAPTPTITAAPANPAPVPSPRVEEPVAVNPEGRSRRAVFTDDAGHFITLVPFAGTSEPLFSGDARKVFRARLVGGGREGDRAWDLTFWDPRYPSGWQRSFGMRDGRVLLRCGQREVPFRFVPPREARRLLRGVQPFEAPWRRFPRALARDDEGNYYLLEGARDADGRPSAKPDFRLWVGPKARMAPVELSDVATDGGGLLAISRAGRLSVKAGADGRPVAEWMTATGARSLTWLAPEDHGPLIYGELSVWGGEPLGTPCDPFSTSAR